MDIVSGLAKIPQSNPSEDTHTNSSDLFSSAKVVDGAAQSQLHREDYDKAKAADLLGAASEYGKLDETQGVGKYVAQGEEYLRKYSDPDAAAAEGKDHVATKIPDSEDSVPAKTVADDEDSGDLKSGLTAKTASAGGDSDVLNSGSGDCTGVLKSSAVGGDYSDEVKTAIPSGGDKIDPDETAGGGVGEYAKKAEGFLSKTAGEAEGEETEVGVKKGEEGGVGDELEKKSTEAGGGGGFGSSVMKMAGGFLKK